MLHFAAFCSMEMIQIRIPPPLSQQVKDSAIINDRSIPGEVAAILKAHYAKPAKVSKSARKPKRS